MRKTIVILLIFVSGLSAQKLLTLDDAVKIALQRNSSLIKGENSLSANEAELKNAYGNLLPDFGFRGSWTWQRISDDGGQKQIDFFGNETITPSLEKDTREYRISAGGNITLFDGLANYSRIAQKGNNLESAQLTLEKLKQDIVYQTTSFYYAVISSFDLVKVREDNVKFNQKLLETIEERNKLGSIPIADVYTQQVSVGNAQLLLIQARNSYENAKNQLLNYLALDIFDDYELVDPFPHSDDFSDDTLPSESADLHSFVQEALKNRFDYQSKKLDVEAAENGITIAQSGLLPSISGNFSFSTSGVKPNTLFDRRIYNVGLSLNIPIFSNWSTESQMQFAEVNKLNTLEDLSALERTIKIEINESYLNLIASKKQLEVTRTNVIAARENRRVNHERYNLGSGTILDVLQSDKDYTQALTDNISARFEYYRNRDKLMNALGKLKIEKYQ